MLEMPVQRGVLDGEHLWQTWLGRRRSSRPRRGGPGSTCGFLQPSMLMSMRSISDAEAGCSTGSTLLHMLHHVVGAIPLQLFLDLDSDETNGVVLQRDRNQHVLQLPSQQSARSASPALARVSATRRRRADALRSAGKVNPVHTHPRAGPALPSVEEASASSRARPTGLRQRCCTSSCSSLRCSSH